VDQPAYLADWLTLLCRDARALVSACGQAQRAVDYFNAAAGWTAERMAAGEVEAVDGPARRADLLLDQGGEQVE
jgi:antirestriction protein ArdC